MVFIIFWFLSNSTFCTITHPIHFPSNRRGIPPQISKSGSRRWRPERSTDPTINRTSFTRRWCSVIGGSTEQQQPFGGRSREQLAIGDREFAAGLGEEGRGESKRDFEREICDHERIEEFGRESHQSKRHLRWVGETWTRSHLSAVRGNANGVEEKKKKELIEKQES